MPKPTMKRVARHAFESFRENDLLSYASAIAFQALFALIPAALAAVAVLGFLDLEEVWEENLRPEIEERVESDAFSVIDRTVQQILGERRGLWLTFGLAFALWQVSGAVRATMTPLNAMYHDEEERSFVKRFAVSLLLAPAVAACIGVALLSIHLGDSLADRYDGVLRFAALFVRWPVAAAALALSIWLLMRFAPSRRHSSWTSLGALFVLLAWLATSIGFGLYATYIAQYGSVFGSLATLIVLLTYLYLSAGAFLLGVQIDASIRDQALGERREEPDAGGRAGTDREDAEEEEQDQDQEQEERPIARREAGG